MRPILEQQTFISTVNLKGTVDGTTENMKFRGGEIINLVTEFPEVPKKTKPNVPASFNVNYDGYKTTTDYTVFYRVVDNHMPDQMDINQLGVQLRTGIGANTVTGQIECTAVKGLNKVKVTTTSSTVPEQDRSKFRIDFLWRGNSVSPETWCTIKDVMVIEGDWSHTDIPFFEDKKGFGPEITVISHNKNICNPKIQETPEYFPSYDGSLGHDADYVAVVTVPVEPNTKYTISFKRAINNFHINTNYVSLFTQKPRLGIPPGRSITGSYTSDESPVTFTTTSNEKYVVIYLGFIRSGQDESFKKYSNVVEWIQVEAGGKATPYQPPGFSHKTYNIKHELFAGDVLEYDKDYNKWVIKNGSTTKWITDVIDPFTYTFNNETWIAVRDQDNILQGSMEFDYFRDPYHAMIGKHMEVIIELLSGEYIDTSLYATIEKNTPETPNPHVPKGCILLKDGRYNNPDRIIVLSDIARIIHLD